jgi:hypothetical protein
VIPPVPFLSGGRFGIGGGGGPGNQHTDVHRVHSFWSSPRFCSPMLVVELRLPVAAVLLRRQIRLVCLLLFFSSDGEDGVDAAAAGFLNFSVVEAVSPFCLVLFVRGGISGTSGVFWVVDGGSRGLLFRSSALRATTADVLFLFLLHSDIGRWPFSVYDSSCWVGKAMALAAHPMFSAASRYGSWICSETDRWRQRAGAPTTTCSLKDWLYLVVFCFSFRVLFEKSRGVFVMSLFYPFNIFPFVKKGDRRYLPSDRREMDSKSLHSLT